MVCPFGAISADPYRKVALKCDFCRKRVKEGKKPECVEACPTHALTFGDTEDLFKSQRLSAAERVARAVSITKEEKKVTPLEMLRSMGGV